MRKVMLAVAVAILLCTTLCGCEDDEKQKAADALDGVHDFIDSAIENAPTGEEIVNGVTRFGDAVKAGVEEYNKER